MLDLKEHPFLGTVVYISLWLLLCLLLAFSLWQLHISILYIGSLIIDNPDLRPTGWSTATLTGISKLSTFTLISVLMIATMYLEYRLRQARDEGTLLAQAMRYALVALAILVVGLALQWLPAL